MSLREDYLVLLILVESQFLNLLPKVSQSSQKMNCSCEFLSKRKKKLFLKVSLEKKRPTTIRTSFAMTSPNKNLLPKSMSYRVPFATHWSVRRKWQFSLQNLQHSKKSNPFIFFFFAAVPPKSRKERKKVRANEKRLSSLEQKSSGSKFSTEKKIFWSPGKKFRTLEPKNPLVPSTEAAEGAAALTLMSLSYKSHFRD